MTAVVHHRVQCGRRPVRRHDVSFDELIEEPQHAVDRQAFFVRGTPQRAVARHRNLIVGICDHENRGVRRRGTWVAPVQRRNSVQFVAGERTYVEPEFNEEDSTDREDLIVHDTNP